jgi:hypothetical protein
MRACSICRRGSPRSRMNRLYKCSVVDIFYRSTIFDPPRTQTKLQTSTMTQTTNKNGAQLHHDSKMKQVNVSCKYCTRAHLPHPPPLESSRRQWRLSYGGRGLAKQVHPVSHRSGAEGDEGGGEQEAKQPRWRLGRASILGL